MESELIAAVKFGPKEKIRSVIDGIVSRMEDARVHYRQYQAYVLAIINVLTQLSQQYDLRISEMFGVENDYFEILGRVQKMENVRPYLTEVALKMNAGMEEERSNTTKNVIREAKQYIQDNFQDPDLSVEKICRHLHMSPAYFSTMFKKETGQAYIAYLTDVRLGRAVELLMATDDKTYIIAEKVGYPEQNYFSYVFKKKIRCFPDAVPHGTPERGGIMGKKRTIWKKKLFDDASIRSMIFIYFTITALAASVLISLSLYQRMSRQVTEVVQEESQNLIAQVGRSVESYLRTIMKLSDSLYYGTIKNADLSSQSLGSEFTLLYDNNKDNVENIALFSEDGALLEAVPAVRLKNEVDVTQEEWFRSALNRTENQHFSLPHVQYVFDNAENQYRWVISLSRAVELTHGTSTSQGVLLVDIRYSSLEQLFGGITTGRGGYFYMISGNGEILYHPQMQLLDSGWVQENNGQAAGYSDGNHEEIFAGKKRMATVKTIGYTGWKVVGVTPENAVSLNTIKNPAFYRICQLPSFCAFWL